MIALTPNIKRTSDVEARATWLRSQLQMLVLLPGNEASRCSLQAELDTIERETAAAKKTSGRRMRARRLFSAVRRLFNAEARRSGDTYILNRGSLPDVRTVNDSGERVNPGRIIDQTGAISGEHKKRPP